MIEHDPFMGEREVETHRRLIDAAMSDASGVREFLERGSGRRVISIPRESADAELHGQLTVRRVPVYPVEDMSDHELYLTVPADARSVHDNLKFIARDVLNYKEIFTQIGYTLGRCAINGFGVPQAISERTMLSSVAFSLNGNQAFGGNVHLLPPYRFTRELTKTDTMHNLESELVDSPYISPAVARELTVAASIGWEHVRDR